MQRYFLIVLCILQTVFAAKKAAQKRYNILSLESQLYKGLMTAKALSYMEENAFLVAKNH